MAYQNVGTPRFYIDVFSTMKALDIPYTEGYKYGEASEEPDEAPYKGLWGLENCSMPNWSGDIHFHKVKVEIDEEGVLFSNLLGDGSRENVYIALLNCKIGEYGTVYVYPQFSATSNNILGDNFIETATMWVASPWSSSIANFGDVDVDTDDGDINIEIYPNIGFIAAHIGAISIGNIYDMPVSPDLDLSMNIEFDGFDNTQTLNGGTLTNTRYMGSPWWYDNSGNKIEPWSVGESTGVSKRNGRRVWNLKFSYMSDKDLFASNYGSNNYAEVGSLSGYDPEDVDSLNLGAEMLMTTNLGDLSNGEMSAGTTQLGWRHHPDYNYDSVTKVDAGVTIVSNGTPDDDDYGSFQSFHSTSFNIAKNATYRLEYNITVNSGSLNYVVVGADPVGSHLGYISSSNYGALDVGEHNVSQIFTANDTDGTSFLEFYTDGDRAVNFTLHSASLRPIYPNDFQYTIDDDNSFSAQVLNRISHGQKFIFQPDNTNNNPDQFAICVLDQGSFSMKRTAHNIYDIRMKIKEVW
tara:strand:- start:33 stop:1595 length:1563 start_codon:yes stop_codon:yes gene_type:complete